MLTVRYSPLKLWGIAILCAVATVFLLMLFLAPETHLPGWLGFFLNGNAGHYLTVPLLVVLLAVTGFRAAWLGADAADAIVADREGVTINTMWRSRRAAWRDVMQVRIVEKTYRGNRFWYLVIDRRDEGAMQLHLGATELDPMRYYEFARTLEEYHLEGIRSPLAATGSAVRPEAMPQARPAAPARPGFGRKTI